MGFWDKLRLVFHWNIDISFTGPLHVHAKGLSFILSAVDSVIRCCSNSGFVFLRSIGSRNPYDILELGAGFVLAWTGKPRLRINQPNEQRELVQIEAESLMFAIPE